MILLGTDAAGNFPLIKRETRLSQQGSEPLQISHWCLILSGPARTCLRFICSTWSLQCKHTVSLLTGAQRAALAQGDLLSRVRFHGLRSDGIWLGFINTGDNDQAVWCIWPINVLLVSPRMRPWQWMRRWCSQCQMLWLSALIHADMRG